MKVAGIVFLGALLTACSAEPDSLALSDGDKGDAAGEYLDEETEVVVIHGDDEASYVFDQRDLSDTPLEVDGQEIDIAAEAAEDKTCALENSQMDVIIVDGKVVDVICYLPPEDVGGDMNYLEVTSEGGDTSIAQNDNNKVIIFEDATDGTPIEGDLSVDSNNVAIYGNGMDNTIIDGNVTLDGNNPVLRGVTITGDLTIVKNNSSVLFCRVLGNVHVVQNNITIAETEIHGNLEFDERSANNAILVNNRVAGDWNINGNGHVCSGNRAFEDKNDDGKLGDGEEGQPLSCGDV